MKIGQIIRMGVEGTGRIGRVVGIRGGYVTIYWLDWRSITDKTSCIPVGMTHSIEIVGETWPRIF